MSEMKMGISGGKYKMKNLKNIGMSAVIIGTLVLLSGCTQTEIEITEKETETQQTGPVYVGCGWSANNDAVEAVAEAVSLVQNKLGEKSPDYIILFSTVGYDSEVVLGEVNKLFPNTQVYGGTSCAAVITKDDYHAGEVGSLALMGVYSENISFGAGGADLDEEISAREAGRKAITEAVKNVGRDGEIPELVLITTAPGEEEEILLGIEDVIGKDVPIIGGSSGDNTIEGYWKQFVNDKVYSNGISLTAIFTDLKIGFAFEAGYLVSENLGNITKAEGRTIYEIDNQSAAEVYNNWTGGEVIDELLENATEGEVTILSESTFYPLSKVLTGTDGSIHYLSIHPLSVNLSDKSLTIFANVEEGDEIQLMHGDWNLLLNRARSTPQNALENGNIDKGEGSFGIYTFCAGTMLGIQESERPMIPLLVEETIGVPFIGTFTFGEQGYLTGVGNRHGNLVNSMIIFGGEEES